jgi:ActR/RegA family two-component response regulator
MKRIHLFEFEDFQWFPNFLRMCMTRYILTMHQLLGTAEDLAELLSPVLQKTKKTKIVDLCSGAGGPMAEVKQLLEEKHGFSGLSLTMTDLYPNTEVASSINAQEDSSIRYLTEPVDATNVQQSQEGLRTMICSMHHMRPATAKNILKAAKEDQQAICIFEISDNSMPFFLWWLAIPTSFLMVFFITPFVRPLSFKQIVFTYLIPLLPIFIAWDGAVSNARTYTLDDWDKILADLQSDDYNWKKGTIKGKAGNKMYLIGEPV